MSPRSIRRAAERRVAKLARQSAAATTPSASVETQETQPVNQARLAANQANAQLSTGPKTEEGRAKSRLNAVKTALTGRTVLLPTDHVEVYQNHVQQFIEECKPVGPRESELVQALADHSWRLDRIAVLEHALYAQGFEQFSDQFANRGEMQAGFIQMHTFLVYEKQFRNLQTQEMRIRRNREKDTAELRRTQSARKQQARLEAKRKAAQTAQTTPQTAHIGFEFSEALSNAEEVESIDIEDIPAALAGLDTDSIPASLASFFQSQPASRPNCTVLMQG